MAAKWQQWMPFHIDRFKASPAVQSMPPAARIGYLYLLSCCWQSPTCTISDDESSLAEMSGLGDELWKIHATRILRKFQSDDQGRLTNFVLRAEWDEAQRVFDARKKSADRTNTARWAVGDRAVTDNGASRSPDTRTGTVTGTDTKKEQKPSPTPRKRSSEVKHSTDPRHISCKAEIFSYYRERNEGEDPDWEGREGRALGMLLGANPKLTADGVKKLLSHRARSDVNHAERPSKWLGMLKSYRNGPLNQFGKPKEMTNGQSANGGGNGFHGKGDHNQDVFEQYKRELEDEDSGGAKTDGDNAGREVGWGSSKSLFRTLVEGTN